MEASFNTNGRPLAMAFGDDQGEDMSCMRGKEQPAPPAPSELPPQTRAAYDSPGFGGTHLGRPLSNAGPNAQLPARLASPTSPTDDDLSYTVDTIAGAAVDPIVQGAIRICTTPVELIQNPAKGVQDLMPYELAPAAAEEAASSPAFDLMVKDVMSPVELFQDAGKELQGLMPELERLPDEGSAAADATASSPVDGIVRDVMAPVNMLQDAGKELHDTGRSYCAVQ